MKPIFLTVPAICVFVGVFSLGTMAFSQAQRPENAEIPPIAAKAALRERLIRLKTEIELLRVEHETAGTVLRESSIRIARADFLKETGLMTVMGMAIHYMKALDEKAGAALAETTSQAMNLIERSTADKGESKKAAAKINQSAVEDAERMEKGLHGAIDRKKQAYTLLTTTLNEKLLDKADAERQYEGSRKSLNETE